MEPIYVAVLGIEGLGESKGKVRGKKKIIG